MARIYKVNDRNLLHLLIFESSLFDALTKNYNRTFIPYTLWIYPVLLRPHRFLLSVFIFCCFFFPIFMHIYLHSVALGLFLKCLVQKSVCVYACTYVRSSLCDGFCSFFFFSPVHWMEEYIVHYIGIITADWVSSNALPKKKKNLLRLNNISWFTFSGNSKRFYILLPFFFFLSQEKQGDEEKKLKTSKEKKTGKWS